LLDLTLQAAPPELADAVRVCAIPAWFDAELLTLLLEKEVETGPLVGRFLTRIQRIIGRRTAKRIPEASALLEQVAAFSFVLPREGGGYVYHEATRARLLDWWRDPVHRQRFAALNDRLARRYLALAREQDPRLSGPDYLDALAVMDAAYPNVRAAWEGAVESENWELMRDFAYALADYQYRRGLWGEKLASAREGLAACERLDDQRGQADMQIILGNAYSDLPTGDRAANLAKAIQCYTEALRVYTPEAAPLDYAMTQNNLGTAYADLPTGDRAANLAKAIECYTEALRVYTPEAAPLDYAMTQNNLGNAYADLPTGDRAANLERAIQCFQEALSIEHVPVWERTRYLRNLGDAYAELEDYSPAITAYQQAIDLNPDDPWLFNALGSAYSRQEQHEQAAEAYAAAVALATDDADRALLHRNRADALIHLDRLDEATRDIEQACALAPDHPYTQVRLGQLAFAREDYSAAVEHYNAAIDRQPEAGFYFDRGLAHLALAHQDQALADYQAAIPLADSITIAEALKELNTFAADHPDTPGLDAIRALLET
jgi:tetratricopeptide (TPR) repeat protein